MPEARYEGGPLDGEVRHQFTPLRPRVPVTAVAGGGFSNVDSFYELVDGVYRWQGPEE